MPAEPNTPRARAFRATIELLSEQGNVTVADLQERTKEYGENKDTISADTARAVFHYFESLGWAERITDDSNTWYGTEELRGVGSGLMRECDGPAPKPPWQR
jgi:hypothetical protein